MRILLSILLAACLTSCSDKKIEMTPSISLYGEYSLDFLTLGLKPLSELPPNASIVNFGGFVNTQTSKSPVKFNLMILGQFELPQSSSSNDLSGVNGKINSITHSVNDQVLLSISNLNLDAKSFIAHINAKDSKGVWTDIITSAPSLKLSKETPLPIKISCYSSYSVPSGGPSTDSTKSLSITEPSVDVKSFISQCLAS